VRWLNGDMFCRATQAQAQQLIDGGLASWQRSHSGWHLRLCFDAPPKELLHVPTEPSEELRKRLPGAFLSKPARQDAKPIFEHKRSLV
jgi:hypothetical protein